MKFVYETGPTHTSPVIVPIQAKVMQKDYALTPVEVKRAVTRLSRLHAQRKAEGKITRIKGRFSPGVILSLNKREGEVVREFSTTGQPPGGF